MLPALAAIQQAAAGGAPAAEPDPAQQAGAAAGPAAGEWGDGVRRFSEIDAPAGALGRFPGSQVMPLIRQFVGLEAAG